MPALSNRPHIMGLALIGWIFTFCAEAASHAAEATTATAQLVASSEPGWPQFRGPRRDGRRDERGLLQSWPKDGPRKLWSITGLGQGYSSPIIVNDQVYITGDVGDELHLFALSLADGKKTWTTNSGASWKDSYPGARTTPTYSAGQVYLQNAHGEIRAFKASSGELTWQVNLLQRFGGNNITWGMSECLLVDDRAVYATAGGREALVVALDKRTGEVLWKSEPLHFEDKSLENASYVSPILVNFAGRELLIGCSLRYMFCIDAKTGVIQWTRPFRTAYSVLAMMPVLVGNSVFMTAAHGKGGAMLELLPPVEPNGKIGFREKWNTSLDTCQGGVVYHQGNLIGSFYPGRKGWAAVAASTGEIAFRMEDLIKGSVISADHRLYILSENGWMRLLETAQDKFMIKGEFRLAEARNDAWAHPVIYQKRLYLRYQEELVCYDIAADSN